MTPARMEATPTEAPSAPADPTTRPNRTAADIAALDACRARSAGRRPAVRLQVQRDGDTFRVGPDHPEPGVGVALLADAMGSAEIDFVWGLMAQLANVGIGREHADPAGSNFMLAVIRGIGPHNEVDAMLAAQMAAVHMACLAAAARLAQAETLPQLEANERAFSRLARTYAAQAEALFRLRSGGKQEIKVVHVQGNAVVGDVNIGQGGGGVGESAEQPHAKAVAYARSAPFSALRGADAEGCAVPIARGRG